MRSIPADLLAAQKSATNEPFVDVIASNEIAGARRLDFISLNATANPIAKHDVAVAGDGSVTRVRIDAGAVKQDRATDPAATGPWNTWTNLATGMGTNVARQQSVKTSDGAWYVTEASDSACCCTDRAPHVFDATSPPSP